MNKKKGLVLSILGVLSLVAITAGVTYAFFNYAKEGTTENTITTGTITFVYEEVEAQGAGISISDALPVSDTVGKAQSGAGNVFNFKVTSKTMNSASIPYTVTARMKADSDLPQSAVKMYLTEVSGENETEVLLNTYDQLNQTSVVSTDTAIEKVIYTDTVPSGSTNYEKNFRLRMWIPDTINFSPVKDENGQDVYPYNGKTFTVTVNVYANAEVVSVPSGPATMTAATALSIGDSVTAIDGSKWHVLEASASGVDTVVLLSDYNLNTDGSYNTNCGGDINSTYTCSPMAFDPDNTNVYNETDSNNIAYFIKNTYAPLVTTSLPNTINVSMPTADQIANVDSIAFSSNSSSAFFLTSSWLLTTNYWTMTARTAYSNHIWLVSGLVSSLTSSSAYDTEYSGIRPVITTPKTNLIAE